jgi:hypothetical protein
MAALTRRAFIIRTSGVTATGLALPLLSACGLVAGYFTFPQTLFKSVKEPPGKGEDVTLMTNLIQGAVVALDQNSAWQAVNKDMGLTVRQPQLTAQPGGLR